MRFFKLGLVGTLFMGCLFAQSPMLSFRADQVVVPPSVLTTNRCVQVGLYLDTTDAAAWPNPATWAQLTMNLDYTLNGGMVLSGAPVVEVSDFVGTSNPAETGIANPGSPIALSSCVAADVVNVATLGGSAADYMGDAVTPASGGNLGFATENVNTGTMHVTVSRLHTADIFNTDDNEYLVAILSFPVDSSTPNGAWIDVNFTAALNQNIINGTQNGTHNADALTDGYVVIFDTLDCAGATVADDIGAASGASIGIDYIDPMAGGLGGEITLTMPHGVADPDEIRITPDDGSGVITLTGGQIGSGSTSLSLSTQADGTPLTGVASVSYTIEYGSTNPLGGLEYGTPCNVTVTWNPASCSMVWDPTPVISMATEIDATLTNPAWDGARFGNITGPNATNVDLVAPSSTVSNVLTFDAAYAIGAVSAADVGTYTLTGDNPGTGTFSCNVVLTLEPPTNTTDCNSIVDATDMLTGVNIGSMAQVTLAGGAGTTDFDITYNGVTTGGLAAGNQTFGPIVGNVNTVTITANGFDATGTPVTVDVVCTLDYRPPTCGNLIIMPAGPVDVGTVLTLTCDTTNAVDAQIDAVSMTAGVDQNTNFNVTWTANHTAVAPTTLDVIVTNPDGETSTCTFTIEVNCAATILSVGSVGSVGTVFIEGVGGGVVYDIYTADSCANDAGDALPGDAVYQGSITLVNAGITTGNGPAGHVILPDTCYYVACDGSDIILDRFAYPTVPTMGEWALIAFSMLLLGAGVVLMRKRREV